VRSVIIFADDDFFGLGRHGEIAVLEILHIGIADQKISRTNTHSTPIGFRSIVFCILNSLIKAKEARNRENTDAASVFLRTVNSSARKSP